MGDLASLLASTDTPPTPPTPSAPSPSTGPELPAIAASAELASIRIDPKNPMHRIFRDPGHRDFNTVLEHVKRLTGIARNTAPDEGTKGTTFREPGDGPIDDAPPPLHDPDAGGPAPIISDPVLRESVGPAPLGAKWEPERIERLSQAAKPEGLSSSLPAILGTIKSEYEADARSTRASRPTTRWRRSTATMPSGSSSTPTRCGRSSRAPSRRG